MNACRALRVALCVNYSTVPSGCQPDCQHPPRGTSIVMWACWVVPVPCHVVVLVFLGEEACPLVDVHHICNFVFRHILERSHYHSLCLQHTLVNQFQDLVCCFTCHCVFPLVCCPIS